DGRTCGEGDEILLSSRAINWKSSRDGSQCRNCCRWGHPNRVLLTAKRERRTSNIRLDVPGISLYLVRSDWHWYSESNTSQSTNHRTTPPHCQTYHTART